MVLCASVKVPCKGVNLDYSAGGSYFIASCEFANSLVKVDTATTLWPGRWPCPTLTGCPKRCASPMTAPSSLLPTWWPTGSTSSTGSTSRCSGSFPPASPPAGSTRAGTGPASMSPTVVPTSPTGKPTAGRHLRSRPGRPQGHRHLADPPRRHPRHGQHLAQRRPAVDLRPLRPGGLGLRHPLGEPAVPHPGREGTPRPDHLAAARTVLTRAYRQHALTQVDPGPLLRHAVQLQSTPGPAGGQPPRAAGHRTSLAGASP
jgi:hypothetical protein